MTSTLGELLPFAAGIAISPIPIIAVILMLLSPRARVNGPAFAVGWVVGIIVVVGIAYTVSDSADVATDTDASHTSSTVLLVLGALLLFAAVRHWRNRPAPGTDVAMPKWMSGIDSVTPVKALGFGFVLSAINPKCLAFGVAAGILLGQAHLSSSDSCATVVVFALISSISVFIPVLWALLGGDNARHHLDSWKAWLSQNNAAVMAVLFLVFGVLLVGKGLQQLG
jgi:threonine/homoserine/homoserine lactone efflux protein